MSESDFQPKPPKPPSMVINGIATLDFSISKAQGINAVEKKARDFLDKHIQKQIQRMKEIADGSDKKPEQMGLTLEVMDKELPAKLELSGTTKEGKPFSIAVDRYKLFGNQVFFYAKDKPVGQTTIANWSEADLDYAYAAIPGVKNALKERLDGLADKAASILARKTGDTQQHMRDRMMMAILTSDIPNGYQKQRKHDEAGFDFSKDTLTYNPESDRKISVEVYEESAKAAVIQSKPVQIKSHLPVAPVSHHVTKEGIVVQDTPHPLHPENINKPRHHAISSPTSKTSPVTTHTDHHPTEDAPAIVETPQPSPALKPLAPVGSVTPPFSPHIETLQRRDGTYLVRDGHLTNEATAPVNNGQTLDERNLPLTQAGKLNLIDTAEGVHIRDVESFRKLMQERGLTLEIADAPGHTTRDLSHLPETTLTPNPPALPKAKGSTLFKK